MATILIPWVVLYFNQELVITVSRLLILGLLSNSDRLTPTRLTEGSNPLLLGCLLLDQAPTRLAPTRTFRAPNPTFFEL